MTFRATGMLGLGLLAMAALAKDSSPAYRVTSVALKQDGRLDSIVLQQCDVTRIVMDAVQRFRPKRRVKGLPTMELVLRVDRVARVGGGPVGPDYGGTDLGISLLSAGSRETNQQFFCRADGFKAIRNPSHCERLDYCSDKIAEQISTWLSWQAAK